MGESGHGARDLLDLVAAAAEQTAEIGDSETEQRALRRGRPGAVDEHQILLRDRLIDGRGFAIEASEPLRIILNRAATKQPLNICRCACRDRPASIRPACDRDRESRCN